MFGSGNEPKRALRWNRGRRACPRRFFRRRPIFRAREEAFVLAFFDRCLAAFDELSVLPLPLRLDAFRRIAVASLKPAGYYRMSSVMRTDGQPKRGALKQVDYLLGMPRIQKAISDEFDRTGLSIEACATIVSDIAHGKARVRTQVLSKEGDVVDLEHDVSPGDRLRAVEMRVRMTTGFAPTKALNANADVTPAAAGSIFDPKKWGTAPPIDVTPAEGEYIAPKRARRGKAK